MMTVINQFALLSNQQNSVPKFYWLSAYFFSSIFLSYAKSIVMKSFKNGLMLSHADRSCNQYQPEENCQAKINII